MSAKEGRPRSVAVSAKEGRLKSVAVSAKEGRLKIVAVSAKEGRLKSVAISTKTYIAVQAATTREGMANIAEKTKVGRDGQRKRDRNRDRHTVVVVEGEVACFSGWLSR